MIRGHNRDPLYEHSLDHFVEFFSKAGSLFAYGKGKRKAYEPYGGEKSHTTALALFQAMWCIPMKEARNMAMKLLFWLRDPRGGAGNRSGARACLKWLATTGPDGVKWLKANLDLIPEHGRVDDWKELFDTELEKDVAKLWAARIKAKDHFGLKWAKKWMRPLQKALKVDEAGLRKLLAVPERQTIEQHMCANLSKCNKCMSLTHWKRQFKVEKQKGVKRPGPLDTYVCTKCGAVQHGPIKWESYPYPKVPSKAMKLYSSSAFPNHDSYGFSKFKEKVKKGEAKINASVLFPHDCVHSVKHGDAEIGEAQFNALPNYMSKTNMRIMPVIDTSGSMGGACGQGQTTLLEIAVALGLYCSDRLGKDSQFYRKYLEFSDHHTLVDWKKLGFADAVRKHSGFGYCGGTNIEAALRWLLDIGVTFKVPNESMVNCLLIVSDMQFNQGTENSDKPVVEAVMADWEKAGYTRPRIVYWNLAGYQGQPTTVLHPNVGLVSGFSPAIMKAVLEGEDFTPAGIMKRAIEKYAVKDPS